MWEAEEAEERNIIHNLPANFSVHAKRQAGGSGSTAAWREVQKPGTQSRWASQPCFLVRASEWPRVSQSMLGQQKAMGMSPQSPPLDRVERGASPVTQVSALTRDKWHRYLQENLRQIQWQVSHKKMRKDANKPKCRFHEKHWEETQEKAKNPNITTRRKNMKKKTYWGGAE